MSYHPPEANEHNELNEIPNNYDAAIVHGGGWREGFDPKNTTGQIPHLSLEAKMRVQACGVLAENGKIQEAIFSGGQTLGENYSSEAEAMEKYFRATFPDLKDFPIFLEKESYDTSENAKFTKDIMDRHEINTVFMITSGFHLKRAQKLFQEFGINTYPLGAEELVKQRSNHHDVFADKYLGSTRHLKKEVVDHILRLAMIVDRKQKLLGRVARHMRNG